jgi:uncharacterized membrane protein
MAFCSNCGAQVEGRFCPTCGAPIGGVAGAPPPQPGAPPPPGAASGAGLDDNAASALCYLAGFITGIIFLVMDPYKNNPRIRFNAWQSIILNVSMIVLFVLLSILGLIPFVGFLTIFLVPLCGLAFFVLWIFLLIKSWQGSDLKLPVIADFARKQAGY